MATNASFDITSPIDFQELDNALNQARKEVGQRYDFKGAKADIELNAAEKTLTLVADDEFKMNAFWDDRPDASGATQCAGEELHSRRFGAGLRWHGAQSHHYSGGHSH